MHRRQARRETRLAGEINQLKKEMQRKADALRKFQKYRRMSSPRDDPLDTLAIDLNGRVLHSDKKVERTKEEEFNAPDVPKFYKYLIRRKSANNLEDGRVNSPKNTWSHISPHDKETDDCTSEFEGGTLQFGDIRRQRISVGGGGYY